MAKSTNYLSTKVSYLKTTTLHATGKKSVHGIVLYRKDIVI